MKRLLILVLVAASCSGGSVATSSEPAVSTSTTTSTPSVGTITVPPTATTTTLAPRPELSEPQVVYFLIDAVVGPPTLVPVWRDATSPQGIGGAIETLLAGPTPPERLGVPAISTDIPADAALLGAEVVNGLATIDLTQPFFGDDEPPAARLAQVVYTATRFDEVDSVAFRVDGEPFPGLPGGTARLGFRDIQSPVFVDEPVYGGPAEQPGRLRGEARIAAEAFDVLITDTDGLTVASFQMPSNGTGWVPFDVALPYSVEVDKPGELFITTPDAVVEMRYPVQLLLPEVGTCSAAGLSPDIEDQGLPEPVDAKRQAIVEAATACDLDALAALAASDFTYSFAAGGNAAQFWAAEEAVGIPVTRLIVQLLETPPVLDPDLVVPTYLWPSAFRAAPTPEDFDLLEGILAAEDLALYRQFNEYLDLRLGISVDGSWDFAVAGD